MARLERRTGERGAVFLAMIFVLVAGVTFILAIYFNSSHVRSVAVEASEDENRAFNLAEMALNESVHQYNLRTDGVDNDNDDETDEEDEGEPDVGCAAWDAASDDLGMDGTGGTGDLGEDDGHPTFGEPNVVPVISGNGEFYAHVCEWATNGVDDDGNGMVDDETARSFDAWARRTGSTGPGIWIQRVSGNQNLSAWNNAIFAGAGGAGAAIHGNVKVFGSIYIEGDSLADDDPALDFSGTAGQRNDYSDGDADFIARLPSLAAGDDLGAELRVEQGAVYLSGTGTVGEAGANIDGLYVGDGTYDPILGNQAEGNVYSDNGATNGMDLPPPGMDKPSIHDPYTDPSTGTAYTSYEDYYAANSIVIPAGQIDKTTNSFSVGPDAQGNYFAWNKATLTMTVTGRVRVEGNLTLGGTTGPTKTDFKYTGDGAILARQSGASAGTVTIQGHLLPVDAAGAAAVFPTGAFLGVIAEGDLHMPSSAQKDLYGAFFAEGTITSSKQNRVGGAFMADTVDMGAQVPSIYFSLGLADAVPDWFIGAGGVDIAGNNMFRVVRGGQ